MRHVSFLTTLAPKIMAALADYGDRENLYYARQQLNQFGSSLRTQDMSRLVAPITRFAG
jgi:hypothetical protein